MVQKKRSTLSLVALLNICTLRMVRSFHSLAVPTATTAVTAPTTSRLNMKTIDSHLHVWATSSESSQYPYAPNQTPPPTLIDTSSTASLLLQMEQCGVDGALIVQPINHQYDHRYVSNAIQSYPEKFKGMMLFDPSINDANEAVARLEELVLKGFVGVRFNPYLFTGGSTRMSDHAGAKKVFARCGELNIPVGIMCFKGMELHLDDILALCESHPDTVVILDHFGFASVGDTKGDEQFDMVLGLAKYNVVVKISAIFRIAGENTYPYDQVKEERFEKLLEAYGADRLMFGTDFPFVMEQDKGYKGAVDVVWQWVKEKDTHVRDAIMGGTAERLFGAWGTSTTSS